MPCSMRAHLLEYTTHKAIAALLFFCSPKTHAETRSYYNTFIMYLCKIKHNSTSKLCGYVHKSRMKKKNWNLGAGEKRERFE